MKVPPHWVVNFFTSCECKIALALRARVILSVFEKIYSFLFIPNCSRNHVITFTNIALSLKRRSTRTTCCLRFGSSQVSQGLVSPSRALFSCGSLHLFLLYFNMYFEIQKHSNNLCCFSKNKQNVVFFGPPKPNL